MAFALHTLPDLEPPRVARLDDYFPELPDQFYMRELEDRPQNPIIDRLGQPENLKPLEPDFLPVPKETAFIDHQPYAEPIEDADNTDDSLWLSKTPPLARQNNLKTWNSMAKSPSPAIFQPRTPFLSEQAPSIYAAIGYRVKTDVGSSETRCFHGSVDEFFHAMSHNVVGNSSRLFIWNAEKESFLLKGRSESSVGLLTVDSLSPITVSSCLERFLGVGTLLRRLQNFVISLRASSPGPAAASFAHGLEAILNHMQEQSLAAPHKASSHHVMALWYHYEEPQVVLESLGGLCSRALSRLPPYATIPLERAPLATRLFDWLAQAILSCSQPAVIKNLAFLSSKVSDEIFSEIGGSLGLLPPPERVPVAQLSDERRASRAGQLGESLPSFLPADFVDEIDRGIRSIALLRATNDAHPLCHPDPLWAEMVRGWCWTDEDIAQRIELIATHILQVHERIEDWRWNLRSLHRQVLQPAEDQTGARIKPLTGTTGEELIHSNTAVEDLGFDVFDLVPGDSAGQHLVLIEEAGGTRPYGEFARSFPNSLPFSAPTLSTLLNVAVLQPLVTHARILSASVLEIFLSDLDFIGHLDLLWQFVLFGNPMFAYRVKRALFTESDDPGEGFKRSNRARQRRKSGRSPSRDRHREPTQAPGQGWGIGLNPSLSDRGAWPPAGSDLAYNLRTVIVDTLDDERVETEDGDRRTGFGKQRDEIWKEAEWRLGFIIKPFDEEDEAEENPPWANPFSLHALDFLEMDYKSPSNMKTLITTPILDKYRRIFTFLIKLLRVDSVTQILYRSTRSFSRKNVPSIFSNRPQIQRRLDHFSFQANAFMHTLTGYITDSAIGANHYAFIERLTKLRFGVQEKGKLRRSSHEDEPPDEGLDGGTIHLTDVFSIMEYHGRVMDRILEACFLKARQRDIGGTSLMEALDTILRVGRLTMDLRSGKMTNEAHAEERLMKLIHRWQECLKNLITGLRILDEAGHSHRLQNEQVALPSISRSTRDEGRISSDLRALMRGEGSQRRDATGLANLLLRLDASSWKKKLGEAEETFAEVDDVP
ncbi:hypothetical protein DL93DRAFT_2152683 [Clavulina sp. PMI_390]|nr:hypothetical protein DL93DRAFT_2152683 [Clavulina sp. PMI_390]